jgi:hypothetical protein
MGGGASAPNWPGRSGALVGDTGPDGAWIAWRVAGANSRELGRSARVYPDLRSCQDSIVQMGEGATRGESLVAMDFASGLWGWRLDIDGVTVAVSGRGYRRERECRYNLRQFLSAVASAAATTPRAS